jgi:AAA family ATP:ADP antiporter
MTADQTTDDPYRDPKGCNAARNWLTTTLGIDPQSQESFAWSASWFATVLGAYYIVRPVREALGSMQGATRLPYFFTAVFLTMLVAVPVYSQLVARFSRRRLVPVVYRFLALNLLLFSAAMRLPDAFVAQWVAPVFFVWVAVYILFATSLFWSVQADVFSRERAKTLFGAISGFGTAGALCTSLLVGVTAEYVGTENLLLISAGLMELGLFCFRQLDLSSTKPAAAAKPRRSNPLEGFVQVVRSPYLRSIMLYTFATTVCGTYLYLTQAELLNTRWPDSDERTQAFARIDFAAQALTVVCQFFIASRMMKYSLTLTLCVLPAIYLLSISGLAVSPGLPVLVAAMIFSRGATYGLAVPAVGVLYTVVSRSDKYKAKSVIDTLVIRGGDVAANWTITWLKGLESALPVLSAWMIPVSAVGLVLGLLLGRRNNQTRITPSPDDDVRE